MGKPVKMAHKLNDKVLNPSSLEKTSVKLADNIFHESTINALTYYANNGYPVFNGTVDFLKLICNLFNTIQLFMGNKLEMKEEIQSEVMIEQKVLFICKNFCNWLKQMFEAAIQTAQTFPPMITYLFDMKNLDYILTGHTIGLSWE